MAAGLLSGERPSEASPLGPVDHKNHRTPRHAPPGCHLCLAAVCGGALCYSWFVVCPADVLPRERVHGYPVCAAPATVFPAWYQGRPRRRTIVLHHTHGFADGL